MDLGTGDQVVITETICRLPGYCRRRAVASAETGEHVRNGNVHGSDFDARWKIFGSTASELVARRSYAHLGG